jgi:hypothetical protein
MLKMPPDLLRAIEHGRYPKTPSTPDDIALIRTIPPLPVPESYIEFITRFGYPQLDPLDDPSEFTYEYREPELTMAFTDGVSAFMPADMIKRYYHGLVVAEDDDLPKFPAFMLPICVNAGQSHVLLECGGEKDRVWFWEFQGDAWGKGNNVRLGLVADSFQAFLDELHVTVE